MMYNIVENIYNTAFFVEGGNARTSGLDLYISKKISLFCLLYSGDSIEIKKETLMDIISSALSADSNDYSNDDVLETPSKIIKLNPKETEEII